MKRLAKDEGEKVMKIKKILVISVFFMLGLVLFWSNNVNATTEYKDTSSNIKYLLDEETKTATVIGYENPITEDMIIPSKTMVI